MKHFRSQSCWPARCSNRRRHQVVRVAHSVVQYGRALLALPFQEHNQAGREVSLFSFLDYNSEKSETTYK